MTKFTDEDTSVFDYKCFCGKPAVTVDTWFLWSPCAEHKKLTPNEYNQCAADLQESEKDHD